MQEILNYSSWDKFQRVLSKATTACTNSGQPVEDHFSQVVKMVDLGSGSLRKIKDYELSRYACYLIVQNGDSSKPVIANGQTYFAMQTRRQELADNNTFQQLKEAGNASVWLCLTKSSAVVSSYSFLSVPLGMPLCGSASQVFLTTSHLGG